MGYLNSLANKVNNFEAKDNFNLQEIDINLLKPSKNNFYGIRDVEELAESIKENGLMHNLVVKRLQDGMYEILSGERRYTALKSLGYEKIPCQVRTVSELDSEIILIQANSKQRELNHIEKMQGINRLKELYELKKNNGEPIPKGKTRDIIGKDVGLSGVQVGRYMKINKDLIPELKDSLENNSITLTQAETLSKLSNEEQGLINDVLSKMNFKKQKQEVDILIQGIKQPVKSNLDKKLLEETYGIDEGKGKLENELNELKDKLNGKKPRIFIYKKGLLSTSFFTKEVQIKGCVLSAFTSDGRGSMQINIDRVISVDDLRINASQVVKNAIRINDICYLHIWEN